MNSSYHTPVLFDAVLSGLNIQPGYWYIDCTLGGGGYSTGILSRGGKVIGIDTDPEALAFARDRFLREFPQQNEGNDWIVIHENFRYLKKIMNELAVIPRGMIMDLGVSSHQLDEETRGFSYRYPAAPFDLRLNQHQGVPASELLNRDSKEELYDILTTFGEEERAFTIVDAFLSARRIKPIVTVGDVLQAVSSVLPTDKEGTLSRVFQAFRIAVNEELEALKEGLAASAELLPSSGRLAVLSFHSLEDRIVKQFFRSGQWRVIETLKRADEKERWENRRSRSAKLRIAEKI